MEMFALITFLSIVMWYVINRGKESLWGEYNCCKWCTIGCAAIGAFFLSFAFNIDIVYALGYAEEITTAGTILTAFVLMSGSSAISEIMKRVQGE